MSTSIVVNFDSDESKRELWQILKRQRGIKHVVIKDSKISNRALSYYFAAIIGTLSDYTGDTVESIHYYLKSKFLKTMVEIGGKHVFKPLDTDEVDATEFCEYIERCKQYCSEEHGIIVLDGQDYLEEALKKAGKQREKLKQIVSSLLDNEAAFVGGKMVFKSQQGEFPEFIRVIKDMNGELSLVKTTEEAGIKIIYADGVCQVRVPDNLSGVKKIEKNKTVIKIKQ